MRHAASPPARRWKRRGKAPGPQPPAPAASAAKASRQAPAHGRLRQLPYWIVLGGTAFGVLSIQGNQDVRMGTVVIAGVLLAAAVARLTLSERRIGMLSSRRRLVDVAVFAVLGAGLLVAGLVVPAPG